MIRTRLIALLAATAFVAPPAFAVQPPTAAVASADVQMEHISIRSIGSGEPVVLIPGLASPRAVYDGIAGELARTRRVLLVQVNGFAGDSPRANAGEGIINGVTADIAAYLEREGIRPAAVIGHSLGGVIGMRLARDHPERVAKLMIVDALPFFGVLMGADATAASVRPMAEMMRSTVAASAGRTRTPSADDPALATMSISPEGRLQVSTWGAAADPRVVGQAMFEDLQEDLRPDLARIARVPTTVLYAIPPSIADRARALWTGQYAPAPSIRMVGVEDSYHFIMLDQPERFAREVVAFLAG
jgi:pimeloyl-ACP methyl ester carboxylesterase